jgi:hypothetical protein
MLAFFDKSIEDRFAFIHFSVHVASWREEDIAHCVLSYCRKLCLEKLLSTGSHERIGHPEKHTWIDKRGKVSTRMATSGKISLSNSPDPSPEAGSHPQPPR